MDDVLFKLGLDAPGGAKMEHLEEVKAQTATRPSTLGTGGETDHDDESITACPVYHWESILCGRGLHRYSVPASHPLISL